MIDYKETISVIVDKFFAMKIDKWFGDDAKRKMLQKWKSRK